MKAVPGVCRQVEENLHIISEHGNIEEARAGLAEEMQREEKRKKALR